MKAHEKHFSIYGSTTRDEGEVPLYSDFRFCVEMVLKFGINHVQIKGLRTAI